MRAIRDFVRTLQKNLSEVPPVVFISADPPQALKAAARSVGATSVRMPFGLNELFEAIKRALAKSVMGSGGGAEAVRYDDAITPIQNHSR